MIPAPEVLPVNIHSNGRGQSETGTLDPLAPAAHGLSQRQLALRNWQCREPTCRSKNEEGNATWSSLGDWRGHLR